MNLLSTRIITANVEALIDFYQNVTAMPLIQWTPDFAELRTANATLAIGSTRTLQFFGADNRIQAAQNKSVIIEFLVTDVDKEYERLKDFLESYLIQKPSLMPWGNKSLLFRDPDGNLVNLFTPVSEEAKKRFGIN
ncbi:MAG: VOC family protein [Sphingobacterium sp.]|jgi:catechol 2,3-dioxygenase-like lactoylglutathione lyase family enzyme|nr:VOC family protein [Sphingobacterium sp.]